MFVSMKSMGIMTVQISNMASSITLCPAMGPFLHVFQVLKEATGHAWISTCQENLGVLGNNLHCIICRQASLRRANPGGLDII